MLCHPFISVLPDYTFLYAQSTGNTLLIRTLLITPAAILVLLVYSHAAPGKELPELRINDTNETPLTTPEQDGFLDIVAGEAFRRAGVKLVLIKLPAERGLISANNGLDDGDLTRIRGLQQIYPNLVRIPEKLIDWEFAAYSKTADIEANWDNLRQYAIGHITGWKIYEYQLKGAKTVISTKSATQLFQLLDRDRIEVALYASWMGQAYIRKLKLQGIHQLKPLVAKRAMFIYLHKKHSRLVPAIAAALRDLKQEGFYQRMYQEKLLPYAGE